MPRRRGTRWTAHGYDRALGYTKHLGTYATRKEAANAEADFRLRSKRTGSVTCDRFAGAWVENYPRPRESTNRHNAERIMLFARDFRGIKLEDVDRPAARAWAKQHPHHLPAARAMFGDAMRDGLIDFNPFTNLRLPGSRGRKDLVALTERELAELADLALDPRMEFDAYGPEYRAMILFAGYVGLRPGELFALERHDIQGNNCLIERAYSSKTGDVGPTKNGRPRTVYVPQAAREALKDVPLHPSGLLFTTPRERRFTQPANHRYWKMLRSIAGKPGMDFYELRHAAATMLLERGNSASDVAQQLGHMDGGQLVMEVYGHPSEQAARGRIEAADAKNVTPIRDVESSAMRAHAAGGGQ